MTYGEKFVKDNFYIPENKKHAYILLKTDQRSLLTVDPQVWLKPGVKKNYRVDEKAGVISIELRCKFAHAVESAGDNVPRIFLLLDQTFTEEAIQKFFTGVWIAHNNVKMRKANTTAFNIARREAKRLRPSEKLDRKNHRQIVHVTTKLSMAEAAESSRVYT